MRLFSSRDELSTAILELGLRQWHDRIMASARPTVRSSPTVCDQARGQRVPVVWVARRTSRQR
jgi:hypothetical protein